MMKLFKNHSVLYLAASLAFAASSRLASGAGVAAEAVVEAAGWDRLRLRAKGAAGRLEGLGEEGSDEERIALVSLLDSLLFELKLTLTN
jgi:hypothetical protein